MDNLTVITGKVRISEDADGRLRAVTLKADDGALYRVVLDVQGELLGLDMAGYRALVHGAVVLKQDQSWLQVVAFDEAPSVPSASSSEDDEPALVLVEVEDDDDEDDDEDDDDDDNDPDDRDDWDNNEDESNSSW
jgi:hypothetical protein